MSRTEAEFDWGGGEMIVVRPQPAIAVYENVHGAIAIRQQADWYESENTFVLIAKSNVVAVAVAMLREAEMHELADHLSAGKAAGPAA